MTHVVSERKNPVIAMGKILLSNKSKQETGESLQGQERLSLLNGRKGLSHHRCRCKSMLAAISVGRLNNTLMACVKQLSKVCNP